MNRLIDNFGREISYLRVSITDRCNYRCIYCQPEKPFNFIPHQEILRYEEILEIVQEAASLGITKVRITGGEPLVRKGVVDFIKKLREIKKLEDISLTTNGFFLGEYANKLKAAGLNRVNVSLDSLQEEKYRKITRGGNLEKVLAGIHSAIEAELFPIKINTVVMKGINDDEIDDFVKLTLKNKVNIRFIEFMPSTDKLITEFKDGFISVLKIRDYLIKKYLLKPVKIYSNNGPAKYYQINAAKSTVGFITALSQHFCESCNRIRLTSDGKIRPCLFSNKEIDIKSEIRNSEKSNLNTPCLRKKLIQEKIIEAVKLKPARHKLSTKIEEKVSFQMSRIGG
ncbi:MAG: GTP 3',8-cyclase MoaA [Candidatus Caldatribacteriota bacterium]|nr:GTP 3',8-cyclase MoaA [Candidatus Caldatribacteriota bacterium]